MEKYLAKLLHFGELLAPHRLEYWQSLTDELRNQLHLPPPPTLIVKNVARKWELVSAYQKTVRRGNVPLAVQLASAMAGFAGERQYMWRRICTTAAEDVGAGNPDLMVFVLAASAVFTPSTLNPTHTRALWAFLTSQMCLSAKSRLYCQFSLMQESQSEFGAKIQTFQLSELGRRVGKIVSANLRGMELPTTERWLVTANWRAEGMSVGPIWHEMLRTNDQEAAMLSAMPWSPLQPLMLMGFPSYAYDKHTQVGKAALTRACALPVVRNLFKEHPCTERRDALGWALFYEEGGKISHELLSIPMADLEQRLIADRLGLSVESWFAIRGIASDLVASGQMDGVRKDVLDKRGYCDNCIQLTSAIGEGDVISVRYSPQPTLSGNDIHRG